MAQGTGTPIPEAEVGVYGPFRPRTGAMTTGAPRPTPGAATITGCRRARRTSMSWARRRASRGCPARLQPHRDHPRQGVTRYEVPPIELAAAVTVRGRVLDATGAPIAGATVVGDLRGERLPSPFPGGRDRHRRARRVPAAAGLEQHGRDRQARAAARSGSATGPSTRPPHVPRPTARSPSSSPPWSERPRVSKAPATSPRTSWPESSSMPTGKPIEGAEVDAWTWYPGQRGEDRRQGLLPHPQARQGPETRSRSSSASPGTPRSSS